MFKVCPRCSSSRYAIRGKTFSCFNCKVVGLKRELEFSLPEVPDSILIIITVAVATWFMLFAVPAIIAKQIHQRVLELPCTVESSLHVVPSTSTRCSDVKCLEESNI